MQGAARSKFVWHKRSATCLNCLKWKRCGAVLCLRWEGRRILSARAKPALICALPSRKILRSRLAGHAGGAHRPAGEIPAGTAWLLARPSAHAHLGLSGRFSITAEDISRQPGDFVYAASANPVHDHVVLELEGGVTITYNDPRRFGFMELVCDGGQSPRQKYLLPPGAGAGLQPVLRAVPGEALKGRPRAR